MIRFVFTLILFFAYALSQIHFSGYIEPSQLVSIKDGSVFDLPVRLAELECGYAFNNSDIIIKSAVEHRWKYMESDIEIREAYWIWYPEFGDISIGKQIHAWGYADANNPTDNVNAYDYYYLFLTGTDRKIGSVSASIRYYGDNWQIQGIIQPEFQPNRLVYQDDFPIKPPIQPPAESVDEVKNDWEFGVRTQFNFVSSDISVSYFHGHERMFSPYQFIVPINFQQPVPARFEYRQADVFGFDMVNLIGDFVLRNEFAFFHTQYDKTHLQEIPQPGGVLSLNWTGKYLQYVCQIEYSGFSDILIAAQLLGNHVIEAKPEEWNDYFLGGMGTPFASIFEQALIISSTIDIYNNSLEIKPIILANLDKKGFMTGLEVNYSPIDNWVIEATLNNFSGDHSQDENYLFNQLEEFSHLNIGIKYSF